MEQLLFMNIPGQCVLLYWPASGQHMTHRKYKLCVVSHHHTATKHWPGVRFKKNCSVRTYMLLLPSLLVLLAACTLFVFNCFTERTFVDELFSTFPMTYFRSRSSCTPMAVPYPRREDGIHRRPGSGLSAAVSRNMRESVATWKTGRAACSAGPGEHCQSSRQTGMNDCHLDRVLEIIICYVV